MFFLAVIINGDAAAADIDAAADVAVADIAEMRQFAARTDIRIFYFYKITDLDFIADDGIRAQMHVGPDHDVILDPAVVSVNELHLGSVADADIGQAHIRPDLAIFADLRHAFQPGIGIDDGIRADLDTFLDKGTDRVHNSNAAN